MKKQKHWLQRYGEESRYEINLDWMLYINLKLWLAESEALCGA